MPKIGDIWYRYYDTLTSIVLTEYTVMHVTAKCVYLHEYPNGLNYAAVKNFCKRIRQEARRQFAYPTIELAAESFRIRKHYQLLYLERELARVKSIKSIMGTTGPIPNCTLPSPINFGDLTCP